MGGRALVMGLYSLEDTEFGSLLFPEPSLFSK
jgi:hypothetical protein